MKTIKFLTLTLSVAFMMGFASDKPAYLIYNKKGKQVSYEEMLKASSQAEVVFFGELHNNAISHWMQYELTNDLLKEKENKVILGAEMFESDNQLIIDEFLSGTISEKKFEAECRLWPNYQTDYKPLMNIAKENNIPFIATNIPRRYASLVYNAGFEGLEKLSVLAKSYVAKLPIFYDAEQDAYKSMMQMGGNGMPDHVNENLPKSQASKDATMAMFIHDNMKKKHLFVHYNGAYHSDKYQGIIYYLNRLKKYDIVTISTVSASDLQSISEEDKAKADFIILVDEHMTSTH